VCRMYEAHPVRHRHGRGTLRSTRDEVERPREKALGEARLDPETAWPGPALGEFTDDLAQSRLRTIRRQCEISASCVGPLVRCCRMTDPFPDLPRRHFGCVLADPPWHFKARKAVQLGNPGSERYVERHYGTMTVADIAALPVRDLAAKDAHLFIWTT